MTKRRVAIIMALTLAAWLLTGCDPKGQSCPHVGDVKGQGGHVYTCTGGRHGNTWQ